MCSHRPKPDLKTFLQINIVGCYLLIDLIQSFFFIAMCSLTFLSFNLIYKLVFISSLFFTKERKNNMQIDLYSTFIFDRKMSSFISSSYQEGEQRPAIQKPHGIESRRYARLIINNFGSRFRTRFVVSRKRSKNRTD